MNNFVTVRKDTGKDWFEIKREISEFIKSWVSEGKDIVLESQVEEDLNPNLSLSPDDSIEDRIRKMLDQYVKPAVEMDGGNIEFKSYHEGVVTVMMQGSCSGCPSSTVTLKSGIESMLKRMMPQVKEVVQEMG